MVSYSEVNSLIPHTYKYNNSTIECAVDHLQSEIGLKPKNSNIRTEFEKLHNCSIYWLVDENKYVLAFDSNKSAMIFNLRWAT